MLKKFYNLNKKLSGKMRNHLLVESFENFSFYPPRENIIDKFSGKLVKVLLNANLDGLH